jgi:hypothetical protein
MNDGLQIERGDLSRNEPHHAMARVGVPAPELDCLPSDEGEEEQRRRRERHRRRVERLFGHVMNTAYMPSSAPKPCRTATLRCRVVTIHIRLVEA